MKLYLNLLSTKTKHNLTLQQYLLQKWYLLIYSIKKSRSKHRNLKTECLSLTGMGEYPIQFLMENGLNSDDITIHAVQMMEDFAPFITGTLFPYALDPKSETLILVKVQGSMKDYTKKSNWMNYLKNTAHNYFLTHLIQKAKL
eukprot:TRINITY_DN19794_c0_g1_i4.p2 TRINITY_DN19794_c0_g1~~TRINITY_DN19794_c0_g1_i4.p2  ORF type:complete len:143 (-),score=5.06 TRINITY_DN19794_c0_g1_i4:683-1111(-)